MAFPRVRICIPRRHVYHDPAGASASYLAAGPSLLASVTFRSTSEIPVHGLKKVGAGTACPSGVHQRTGGELAQTRMVVGAVADRQRSSVRVACAPAVRKAVPQSCKVWQPFFGVVNLLMSWPPVAHGEKWFVFSQGISARNVLGPLGRCRKTGKPPWRAVASLLCLRRFAGCVEARHANGSRRQHGPVPVTAPGARRRPNGPDFEIPSKGCHELFLRRSGSSPSLRHGRGVSCIDQTA